MWYLIVSIPDLCTLSYFKDDKSFTKIDLRKGFRQIMVEKSSQLLTAFSTTDGSYMFKKIPFGFVNYGNTHDRMMRMILQSGITFNRMTRKLLHGWSNADNYVDDKHWDDHLFTLSETFYQSQRCRIHSETIKVSDRF